MASPPPFHGLRSFGFHSGSLRHAIHQFKYEDVRVLASPLGTLMADGWSNLAPRCADVDAIVPVPLHPKRERRRGYNQATLLARELGNSLGLPVETESLIRTRATLPQTGLGAQDRHKNVHGAFACDRPIFGGMHVLLVDDVCTTGSTLEAAGCALYDGGAVAVWAYTLARAKG